MARGFPGRRLRRGGQKRRPGTAAAAAPAEAEPDGKDGHQWMVRERPSVRFADVAGLERVKEDIRLKMIYPFQHPELAAKFGVRPGGGVLLYGPPGTGKTLLAKATAGELDAAFFTISPADILSKWVGEAEQNVKKLFDAAAAEPRSVIFIDEIEALIPARQDRGQQRHAAARAAVPAGHGGVRQEDQPDPVHGRNQRALAARPGRAAAGPVRREGVHPAAGPGRPPQAAGAVPGPPAGGRPTSTWTRSRPTWTGTAGPTSSTSATARP